MIASRRLLRAMEAESAHQMNCSFLRNAIESNLVALRTTDAWLRGEEEGAEANANAPCKGSDASVCDGLSPSQKDDVQHWHRTVREIGDWLDNNGENANLEELDKQQQRSASLKKVILKLISPLYEE
ncbi:unnamed protein product [Phytomonas sp. Hart1]|nr:unnamed protein product [Phytomonas sp. Hart1]|eukprot:CCW71325.1 unnamed protein product [Phytomonas sp. isolate Hart1]